MRLRRPAADLCPCLGLTGLALLAATLSAAPDPVGTPRGPANDQPSGPKVPAGVEYQPDLVYCKIDEKTELQLDVAVPKEGRGPFPAVVCIHGGGFLKGSRKTNLPLVFELAQKGYVGVTVSYRFAPQHLYPAQVHDVKCAVRWLRANAEKYRIDKDRIAALGYSSGGQLACLLGSTTAKDGLEGQGGHADQSSRVQAVVGFYPLTDLARLHQDCAKSDPPPLEKGIMLFALKTALGGSPKEEGDCYAKASPVTYVSKDVAPTLLIHGTADKLVPFDQSEQYAKLLKEAKASVTLLALDDAPHNFGGEFEKKANAAALAFLEKHLKDKKLQPEQKNPWPGCSHR